MDRDIRSPYSYRSETGDTKEFLKKLLRRLNIDLNELSDDSSEEVIYASQRVYSPPDGADKRAIFRYGRK